MHNLALFSQVALLILLAPIFARTLKLPVAVVEIILGTFLAWYGFVDDDDDIFRNIAEIGFFYLMFLAGLEIEIKKFLNLKESFFARASIYFISLYILSIMAYFVFNLSLVYMVAIPTVSLGMIMALINDHGREQKWLDMALLVGAFGELLSIAILVLFDAAINHGVGLEFYKSIAILVFILLVSYYLFKALNMLIWWFPELRKIIMPEKDNMSQDIRVSMAFFFIFIAVMQYLGIDMVLGSFIAGVFLGNLFSHKVELPHTLNTIGFGFLIPLFFIYIGSTLDLHTLFTEEILYKSFFIVMLMLLARVISTFIAYGKHWSIQESLLFALSSSMPLTLLIAIVTIAMKNSVIDINEYYFFIFAAVLEALIFMVVINFSMKKYKLPSKKKPQE
ncbi:MAG: cation:proton antiporter [Campylobacterales bacterium]|nr:cation:proton antiporter [Campylobacterales bacterium]